LYRLLLKRRAILQEKNAYPYSTEGFTPLSNGPSISNLNINALTNTNGITDPINAKKIKQFFIKASYHTAYNGTDLNVDMVTSAMNRGYRWLHFCVADDCSGNIKVVYTTDDTLKGKITTPTNPLLTDIMSKIVNSGFVSPDSPNKNDPIFIQIVPLYETKSSEALITNIKALNNDDIKSKIYQGPLTKDTTIDQLMGKIVLLCKNDLISKKSDFINFSPYDDNEIIQSIPFADVPKSNLALPLILKDNFTTNPPNNIIQILPTGANANSDVYSTIQATGAQITPQCIWSNDGNLANYEAIFNNANAGIVPLSTVLKYTKKNDPNKINSSYPGAFSGST
jgi:hypothetical protein